MATDGFGERNMQANKRADTSFESCQRIGLSGGFVASLVQLAQLENPLRSKSCGLGMLPFRCQVLAQPSGRSQLLPASNWLVYIYYID